ncbi:MAG: hypothetical protein E6J90_11865 [Deltaproteobacteria bacterium]|nr:MAG: hypothetical protein E6J90_11865 [Deltaproteobacteria bacterium]
MTGADRAAWRAAHLAVVVERKPTEAFARTQRIIVRRSAGWSRLHLGESLDAVAEVVWLAIGLALSRNRSIQHLVNKLDLALPNASPSCGHSRVSAESPAVICVTSVPAGTEQRH